MIKSVRCWECERRTDPARATCAHCGAQQLAICACGASISTYSEACAACGQERGTPPRRWPRWLRVWSAVAAVTVLLATSAVAIVVLVDTGPSQWESIARAGEDLDAGRDEIARRGLLASIAKHGAIARSLRLLGIAEHRLGNYREAERRAREALELDPSDASAHLLLVQSLLAQERADDALEHARIAVAARDDDPRLHEVLAWSIIGSKDSDPEEAETHLWRALRETMDQERVVRALGELILVRGEAFPATLLETRCRRVLYQARIGVGRSRDAGRGIEGFRLAVRMDTALGESPDIDALCVPARTGTADLLYCVALGRLAHRVARADIVDEVLQGLALGDATAKELVELADVYTEVGEPEAAARAIEIAERRFPLDARVLLQRAHTRLADGRTDDAEQILREGITEHPSDERLTSLLVQRVLVPAGRRGEAEDALRHAMANSPEGWSSRLLLASLLVERAVGPPRRAFVSSIEEADALLQAARHAARRLTGAQVLVNLVEGQIHLAYERPSEAIESLTRVTRAVPTDPMPYLLLAQAHDELNEPEFAADVLTAAIELTGSSPLLHLVRARARRRAGLLPGAANDANAVLRADPENAEAGLLLARLELADGRARRALDRLSSISNEPALNSQIAFLRARAEFALGDEGAARASLHRARETATTSEERHRASLDLARLEDAGSEGAGTTAQRAVLTQRLVEEPADFFARSALVHLLLAIPDIRASRALTEVDDGGNLDLLVLRGECCLESDDEMAVDRSGAADAARRVNEIAPGSPQDVYLRGRLTASEGDWRTAAELFRIGTELSPDVASFWCFLGMAQQRNGESEAARLSLARAVHIDPSLELPRQTLVEVMCSLGGERLASEEPGAALALFREALSLAPDAQPARAGLAEAASRLGRRGGRELLARAETEAEALLDDLPPSNEVGRTMAWISLGNLRLARGDHAGFLEAVQHQLELAGRDPTTLARLGSALSLVGRADEARELLITSRREFDEAPELVRTHVGLLVAHEEWARALAAAAAGAESRPDNAMAQRLLGRVQIRMGLTAEGLATLRRAVACGVGDFDSLAILVDVLLTAGRFEEAERETRTFRATSPRGRTAACSLMLSEILLRSDPLSAPAERLVTSVLEARDLSPQLRLRATYFLFSIRSRSRRFDGISEAVTEALRWIRAEPACLPGEDLARPAAMTLLAGAVVLDDAGFRSLARACYGEVLERDPDEITALNNLADILAMNDMTADESVVLAQRATALQPALPELHGTLGNAQRAAGAFDAAISAYERASVLYRERRDADGRSLTGHPDSRNLARSLLRLAATHQLAGDEAAASRELANAVTADPDLVETVEYRALAATLR